jgi:hypothetical protein
MNADFGNAGRPVADERPAGPNRYDPPHRGRGEPQGDRQQEPRDARGRAGVRDGQDRRGQRGAEGEPVHEGEPAARQDDPEAALRKLANRALRGSERDKLSVVSDATNKFTYHFHVQGDLRGDVVGGDKLAGPAVPFGVVGAGPVGQQLLDKIADVYVRPPAYAQAQRFLEQHRLVILQGPARWGKATMALHLLLGIEVLGVDGRRLQGIHRFGSETELATLKGGEIELLRGYLVDTLAPYQAVRLTDDRVERLQAHLEARRSCMVVTVDQAAHLPNGLVRDLAVRCGELSDPVALLRRHLRWYLRTAPPANGIEVDPDAQDRLLAHDEVRRELDEQPLPSEIDRMARLLRGVLCGEETESRAFESLRHRSALAIEDHFRDEQTTLRDRAFMISLSVLDGAPYEAVAEAADRLEEALHQVADPRRPLRRPPFGRTREDRLHLAWARIPRGQERVGRGSLVQGVTFRNPAYPRALLDYVWREFDTARGCLLEWFELLAQQPGDEVPLRTAVALGRLGTQAFPYLRARVLDPWAASGDPRLQEIAALALSATVQLEPALTSDILALLQRWSDAEHTEEEDEDDRGRRWTAAVAFGWHVGATYPELALDRLEEIAGIDDVELALAVAMSTTRLFDAGKRREVVDALLGWIDTPRTQEERVLVQTAALSFLRIAATSFNEPGGADLEGERWPTLLWLTDPDASGDPDAAPGWLEAVTRLWRHALNTSLVVDVALDVLRDWVDLADEDDRLLPLLRRIVLHLPQHERDRRRLEYKLERWSETRSRHGDGRRSSRAAGELLRALKAGKEQR